MVKTKLNLKYFIDVILVFLLAVLSIKKGGFYKTDSLFFYVFVIGIAIVYTVYNYVKKVKTFKSDVNKKVDIIGVLLLLLSLSYSLPIMFGNYASLSSSLFEMIKYFCVYLIYLIVKNSDNKSIFINGIVVITVLQCFIGIDGLASRYLTNILGNVFNSGYLSIDLTRMSSTIQYANVFAILCSVSSIIVLDKLIKIKRDNTVKQSIKLSILFTTLFILLSSIMLSMSRSVLVITAIALIIYACLNKENLKHILTVVITQIIGILIYTSLVNGALQVNPSNIYYIFAIALVINLVLGYILSKIKIIYSQTNTKIVTKKNIVILISAIVLVCIYIVVGLIFDKPLKMDENSKDKIIERKLYDIKSNESNKLDINVSTLKEDTRYKINVFEIDDNFSSKNIKSFNYYENTSGNFTYDFIADKNTKAISIQVQCEKGSIQIDNISLNGNKEKIDYLLLPSDIVFRLEDVFHGSSSINDRFNFIADSMKIISSSPQNFIFGTGGDGFENLYNRYQNYFYISTEVHNSYIQIFVESGIIGFLVIVSLVILTTRKSKLDAIKLALLTLIVHSIFDLNFSFLITLCVFAILIALLENKDEKKVKNVNNNISYIVNYSQNFITFIMLLVTIYISTKAYMSYNIKVPELSTDVSQQTKQIDSVLSSLEEKVNLDGSEYDYRKSLNDAYNTYVKLLSSSITSATDLNKKALLQAELVNIINNIKINADTMLENDRYNRNVVISVCNIYFKNLGYFVAVNYNKNNEEGYKVYLDKIMHELSKLEEIKYNQNVKDELKDVYNDYLKQLKEANITIESEEISNAINYIQEKLK